MDRITVGELRAAIADAIEALEANDPVGAYKALQPYGPEVEEEEDLGDRE